MNLLGTHHLPRPFWFPHKTDTCHVPEFTKLCVNLKENSATAKIFVRCDKARPKTVFGFICLDVAF